jgi:hypothetical protein
VEQTKGQTSKRQKKRHKNVCDEIKSIKIEKCQKFPQSILTVEGGEAKT